MEGYRSSLGKILKLEESTAKDIPLTFTTLIQNLFEERKNLIKIDQILYGTTFSLENDLMVCLIITIFAENGFTTEVTESKNLSFDIRALRQTERLPSGCRNVDRLCYMLSLFLPLVESYQFLCIIVPVCGDTLVINLMVKVGEVVKQTISLALRPERYLQALSMRLPEKFRNLKELSSLLSRRVLYLRDTILNDIGTGNPSLLGLPCELLEKVLFLLPIADFLRLTSTCKKLFAFTKKSETWKKLLQRDFFEPPSSTPFDTYVQMFRAQDQPVFNFEEEQSFISDFFEDVNLNTEVLR